MPLERAVIVGLGNPGSRYEGTRHNAGAMVAALLADRLGGRFGSHKSRCLVAEGRLVGVPAVVAVPTSYMNDSGGPVTSLVRYYKVPLGDLVVVHDELDLPFGALRLKRGGGDGGHNGLRSISASLGRDYARVRVGIGRPPGRQDPADYVLREFSGAERKELPLNLDRAADAVEALITDGLEAAQNRFND